MDEELQDRLETAEEVLESDWWRAQVDMARAAEEEAISLMVTMALEEGGRVGAMAHRVQLLRRMQESPQDWIADVKRQIEEDKKRMEAREKREAKADARLKR